MEKILVVEDELEILSNICESLELEGYQSIPAKNGKEGLDILSKQRPDLIISDIRMPEMDGLKFIKEIRKDPIKRLIPFIFLTVLSRKQDVQDGLKLGALDYIHKPYDLDDFLTRVRRLLDMFSDRKAYQEGIHDLKNILQAISGYAEYLKFKINDDKLKEKTEIILQASQRMKHMIFQMLGQGNVIPKKVDIDLSDLAKNEVDLFKAAASQKNQNLFFNSQDDCLVSGYNISLSRAMGNIINNAIKYSPKGTSIDVRISKDCEFVYFKVCDQGPGLVVSDNGIISDDAINNNCQKTNEEDPSFGYGLKYVRKVLKLHNGTLELESEFGNGATFTMIFPKVC